MGKLARESLNAILGMAEQQEGAFYLKVTNDNVNTKVIPVGQIMVRLSVVRCDVPSETGNIGSIIKKSYEVSVSGAIADGIAEVLEGELECLLGSFSGSTSKREIYTITTGSFRGIQRVDIGLYAYRSSAEQLTEIAKNLVSAFVIISSVDPNKITEAMMRVLVQDQFPAEKQEEILDSLLHARRDAMPTH